MAVHRPLSSWIARLVSGAPGTAASLGRINDGNERADAREMSRFRTAAWARTSVTVGRNEAPARALALQAADGSLVVELDDFGRPLPVTEDGADLIAGLEESWTAVPADPLTVARLQVESLELRYLLLHRLERETAAPAALFHCLPWSRVEAAAHSVAALLDPVGTPSSSANGVVGAPEARELRHWFTPAATSLAGPLSVLEAGLRSDRGGLWFGREAADLLTGLFTADPARLPASTRSALAALAERLGADPTLRHGARLASTRLTGPGPGPGPSTVFVNLSLTARLDSEFVLLASSGEPEDENERVVTLREQPLTAEVAVTRDGMLDVELAIEDDGRAPARTVAQDGPLCYPVRVSPVRGTAGARAPSRYWMMLDRADSGWNGFLTVPVPDGQFDIGLDAPPLALPFLDRVPLAELRASLHANELIGSTRWHGMIDGLHRHHPAHAALAAYDAELPE
ncbi:hypothetical protein P1S61_39470 [Streptomyces sp. ME08-AFT2]|uniref:hypothetical protein n=1 Tax=Streptomyces sp. ME08-AFT2 TaxID=3028683 RepID=UPI0029B67900|nr:hypothetical protein [Streptomyces sp. ME08-AFT2]MDX3315035.1 hypothetical protein [Streptomyces sp. ME08-AFT2]